MNKAEDNKDQNKKPSGLQEDENMIIESSEGIEVVKSFDELGLREEL